MPHLLDKKNMDMLISHKIFSERELVSREEIMLENYCKTVVIEANSMVDLAKCYYAPAVAKFAAYTAGNVATKKSIDSTIPCEYETSMVKRLSVLCDRIAKNSVELQNAIMKLEDAENIESQAYMIRDTVLPKMADLRAAVDEAETITAKDFWPFPSYADMLFSVR